MNLPQEFVLLCLHLSVGDGFGHGVVHFQNLRLLVADDRVQSRHVSLQFPRGFSKLLRLLLFFFKFFRFSRQEFFRTVDLRC